MIPYSEKEQKRLVDVLCRDIFASAGKEKVAPEGQGGTIVAQPPLQLLFDLEFEQKFKSLVRSIYQRLPRL
jgi:hypothetical protein